MTANVRSIAENGKTSTAGHADLSDAFRLWMQVSIAGIGGSALQIATMRRLLVEGKQWISEKRFYHALGYCIALPGPETQQLAVYVGWLAHRTIGGVIAGGLFILPGMICMMALSFGYVTGANSRIVQAILFGVKPAVLVVMLQAMLLFASHVIRSRWMLAIAALAFLGAFVQIAFPLLVLAAGLFGACGTLSGRPSFAEEKQRELPDHAQPCVTRFLRSLALWLAVWLAPPAMLVALFGAQNIYTQISIVFGKVALMAVAGDYAVIAYAAQQAVDSHHWVSASEMQEAVAMGEMVPGTIMIVTQFLGFITAYRDPGSLPPLLAGAFGGILATWMTFVPCFLFILSAAPFIEGLGGSAVLNRALNAVTAAAVGMIANLTVWFGVRTLFHQIERFHYAGLGFDVPLLTSLDPWASGLFIIAATAALVFKFRPVSLLLTSSVLGLVLIFFAHPG